MLSAMAGPRSSHSSSVSLTRSEITAGSSFAAKRTVRSNPFGPVMRTFNPPRSGSAEIQASCAPGTCFPPDSTAAAMRSRRVAGMPLASKTVMGIAIWALRFRQLLAAVLGPALLLSGRHSLSRRGRDLPLRPRGRRRRGGAGRPLKLGPDLGHRLFDPVCLGLVADQCCLEEVEVGWHRVKFSTQTEPKFIQWPADTAGASPCWLVSPILPAAPAFVASRNGGQLPPFRPAPGLR